MLVDFLLKKAIGQNSQGLSPAEQERLVTMVETHSVLFMKLAEEFKQKIAAGKNNEAAAMEIIQSHEAELRALGE